MASNYCTILGGHRFTLYSNGDVEIEQFAENGHVSVMSAQGLQIVLDIRERFIRFQQELNEMYGFGD